MAPEEFQAGICGESWWTSINSTSVLFPMALSSSSPCSQAANDAGENDIMELKATRFCADAEETNNSVEFLDRQKPHTCESASEIGSILIDSTSKMMGFGVSSSTSSNWNQSILHCSGRPESNSFHSSNSQIPKSFSATLADFKPMNQEFPLDQQSVSSVTSTDLSSCGFPIGSPASYGYPSTLIQSLYESDPQPQPQHSLFTNRAISYNSSRPNYGTSSIEPFPTWSTVSSMPKQHHVGIHFSNDTPFWNASAKALNDIRPGAFPSSQAQYQKPTSEEEPCCPSTLLNKLKSGQSNLDSASVGKRSVCEPAFKRTRIVTPSPFPTFKVRKEKLGDRITTLQQLVSPFGKTDTASVLHEAIEYIKFLHDQVNALSTPYMRNGVPSQHQQGCGGLNDSEGQKQDLRSRGLCLVPISSTFPVANETSNFWAPTFGGSLIQ